LRLEIPQSIPDLDSGNWKCSATSGYTVTKDFLCIIYFGKLRVSVILGLPNHCQGQQLASVVVLPIQVKAAPGYLAEICRPVSSIDRHRHLWSARRGQLDVPRVRLSTYGGRAFCHAGPSV